jgi:glycosyltransferase involved in cell wall biosynthesis
MAAGLPVVSTRRGAIPETVVDGETGLLVEARDTPALTAALRRLIMDPELREKIGRAARARYVACYSVEKWSERMARVFADVTAGRGP